MLVFLEPPQKAYQDLGIPITFKVMRFTMSVGMPS
jgi:hypothetical protein